MQLSIADAASPGFPPLRSFLIGGFEGADHRNSAGIPVAMLDVTGHARDHVQNYARLRAVGIRAVRESVGWSRAERDGRFDFACALRRADAARRAGIDVIWTLWHYGLPDDLDVFDPALAERFADFAHAAAEALRDSSSAAPVVCPINEISFLAWAVCESSYIHPHRGTPGPEASARGFALKKRLVRAALAACDAIRDAIPNARLLHIDPLLHVVAPPTDPAREAEAARVRSFQFQAFDMLTGRLAPELGGAPRYVDCVGVNYYHGNQFEVATDKRLHWHLRDPRRIPFRDLLRETFARYEKPLLIAETSHVGVGRGRWIVEIAREVRAAMQGGVPVAGLCLYPIVDRPDWERLDHWHHSGLWDRVAANDATAGSRLDLDYLSALRLVQHDFDDGRAKGRDVRSGRALVVFTAEPEHRLAWHVRARIAALRASSTVIVVPVAGAAASDVDAEQAQLASIVDDVLRRLSQCGAAPRFDAWVHTATALPILAHLAPDVIAYSPGMDVDAVVDPRQAQRHEALLRIASIVGDVSRAALERARPKPATPAARFSIPHYRLPPHSVRHEHATCVIVGAGVAGLCAAWRHGDGALILERDAAPGGSRRSVVDQGFRFDSAAHVIDGGRVYGSLYRRLLGDNVGWRAPSIDRVGDPQALGDDMNLAPFRAAFSELHESVGYPLHGGTQALVDGFLALSSGAIACGTEVVRILPRERSVVCEDGRRVRYERLIVTLPLPALVALCDRVPDDVREAAQRLRTLALRNVSIGFRGPPPTPDDWLLDATDAPFDRVFLQGNVAPHEKRPGHFALACEIVHSASRPLAWHGSLLVNRCIDACVRAGWIGSRDDVVVAHETDFPSACVVDDEPRAMNRRTIARWLAGWGIGFTGSHGVWEIGRCAAILASACDAALAARHATGRACEAPLST